ncbi:DUF3089 domain-containing protein [Blastomonas sp.]|uniref:DUF3089 domain-containing protein n=1 Tax=Blastomonas sp. TaxID=1909299 RepID=UPI0035941B24
MARKFLYLIAAIIVLIIAAFTAYQLFSKQIFAAAFVPTTEFVQPEAVETSAYTDVAMWFSRPEIPRASNPALWTPEGFEATDAPKVAVFYIHPTSYLKRALWNAPISDTESQDRARIFLRSQASVFNGIGQIWAPRYRQAAIGAFLTDKPEAQRAFDAAYADIITAFDEFLAQVPEDMPIIIAGHSQGGLHLTTLMRQRVVTKPLADRIVAAYVIGWPVSMQTDLLALGLPPCSDPEQTGCMLSWQSFGEPADPGLLTIAYDGSVGFDGNLRGDSPMLCTNPLTGVSGDEAPAEANIGTLVPNEDLTDGVITPALVAARCDDRGLLLLGGEPNMGNYVLPGNNYHVYDYPLFWANIRADVERRAAAFLAR